MLLNLNTPKQILDSNLRDKFSSIFFNQEWIYTGILMNLINNND